MKATKIGIIFLGVLIMAAPAFSSTKRSPAYKRTLKKAQTTLRGITAQIVKDARAEGKSAMVPSVTSGPGGDMTRCNPNPVVCTASPEATTKCSSGSNTWCTTDPACGPTSRPSGTNPTLCRGQKTACVGGNPVVCTAEPNQATQCPNSDTYCPKAQANCFTYNPGGSPTLCTGMLTLCYNGKRIVCTRLPKGVTECTGDSRTKCPQWDVKCDAVPVAPESLDVIMVPPVLPRGQHLTEVALLAVNGNDLIVGGEMQVSYGEYVAGEPAIEVLDVQVVSPVEAFVELRTPYGMPLGPINVFVAGGDDINGVGEIAVHMGAASVVPTTPTLSTGGMIAFALLLLATAVAYLKRRRKVME